VQHSITSKSNNLFTCCALEKKEKKVQWLLQCALVGVLQIIHTSPVVEEGILKKEWVEMVWHSSGMTSILCIVCIMRNTWR